MAVHRQLHSRITELEDGSGRCFSSTEDYLKLATNYFISLFSASEMGLDDHVFGLVEKKVAESMNESLLKAFLEEEIVSAVKMMEPLKVPGVNGFPVMFLQRYWHIIGPKISSYCLSILRRESQFQDINRTHIVLLPKVEKPRFLSQFCPISLCTVMYKIVAKVVVNRMSTILGEVIDEAQGAFIPGRLISDNVLIAYEIFHSLKRKKTGNTGNFALKLDMSKAYDRVEWDFLAGMMTKLDFHTDWVVLVMRCVCSVSYSVSLNGDCGKWFSPSRGLRQGDPLSPYLFLICAEGFSTLLVEEKQKGLMKGAPIGRERLSINHLFFTNDCILFGDASYEGACVVRDVIREYEMISGQ
ncbi:hypothetical protein J1N35_023685 [Gossypium stocksii]|uniref:Reverse transcriptase domain-containing protein n=1 Tax=Gossypium stocksii TaxID=47602 RepID=A0A9D3VJZ2_9ROSI|nr:hypothetical protein J1N35_023685 [Gossypium stocksii]